MKLAGIVFAVAICGLAASCQTTGSTANQTTQTAAAPAQADQPLDKDELAALIIGKTVTYRDNSKSIVHADGTYNYIGPDGKTYPTSTYAITQDGAVCLKFRSGGSRCDTYVRSGDDLVLINRQGTRYKVIDIKPIT